MRRGGKNDAAENRPSHYTGVRGACPAVFFLWLLFKTQILLYLCLGASFAVLASKAVFYRCPHCRRYLHRVYGKCCPYCGKELGL